MRIEDKSGNVITTQEEWATIYDTSQKKRHWRPHRSAYSMADFIMNHKGSEDIQARVAAAIQSDVVLELGVPECEIRFDEYGRGRVHDLAIYGHTGTGKSLFVGIEAKVDEPFGDITRDVYLAAKTKQIAGKSTNAPARIEQLLSWHFSKPVPTMFDVRYQLLYSTVGTLAAVADLHVLYVIVFKTPLYNEVTGAENYRDYVHFMDKVGAEPILTSIQGVVGHQLNLCGKHLICLYETIVLSGEYEE